MADAESITQKISIVQEEMRNTGLWKKQVPDWVIEYDKNSTVTEHEFGEWLQFVYLPNLLLQAGKTNMRGIKKNIVPQVLEFYGDDIQKGKLLQLLIELDSLV